MLIDYDNYREPTLVEFEVEAQTLRVCTDFRLSIEETRNRVVSGFGYLSWISMVKCKNTRSAD